MKKFVKLFAIVLCAVVATAALVGCSANTVPLTEENVAGKWELTYATYTPHAQSEYAADTCTKAEWDALNAKLTDKTDEELIKFDIFEDKFYTYELRANQKSMFGLKVQLMSKIMHHGLLKMVYLHLQANLMV